MQNFQYNKGQTCSALLHINYHQINRFIVDKRTITRKKHPSNGHFFSALGYSSLLDAMMIHNIFHLTSDITTKKHLQGFSAVK